MRCSTNSIRWALLAAAALVRCAQEHLQHDEPLPFSGKSPDAGPPSPDWGPPPDLPPDIGVDACIPDPCDGVIEPRLLANERSLEELCFSFIEVGSARGFTNPVAHRRMVVVDYNQDGRPDIHLLNEGIDAFFRNTGKGFESVAAGIGLSLSGTSRDAVWSDFDGDGDLDSFVVRTEGSQLYLQNPDGTFSPSSDLANSEEATAGVAVGSNVLLGTVNGLRYLLFGSDNEFPASRDAAWAAGFVDPGEASIFAPADYDGDEETDIYVANITGQDRLYQNQGDGTFRSAEEEAELGTLANSTDADWVSFDGEDLPSLSVTAWDGANFLYRNRQDGTFADVAGDLGVRDPGRTVTAAWGDFLNEGRPSVFKGRDEMTNLLYVPVVGADGRVGRYIETATPLGMALSSSDTTMTADWLDYNGDGLLDLAAGTYAGSLYLFENRTGPIRLCPYQEDL